MLGWCGAGPVGNVHSTPHVALLHCRTEINKAVVEKQLVLERKEKNRSAVHFKLNL
jgi:hypothetical protein